MPSMQNESSTLLKISEIETNETYGGHLAQTSSIRTLARDASSKVLVKKRVVTSPRKLRDEAQ